MGIRSLARNSSPTTVPQSETMSTTVMTISLSHRRKRSREAVTPLSEGAAQSSLVSPEGPSTFDEDTPHLIHDESTCRPKKRVRFAQSVDGEIEVSKSTARTSSHFLSSLPSASLSKGDLWWSKEDRELTIQECMIAIKEFRVDEDHVDHMNMFANVYETCMAAPSHATSDYLMEQAMVSLPAQIRGLEWGIAPKLKARRKAHIRDVLDVQNRIRNPRDREKFVASRSLTSSRPSRIIARMIGEGDAISLVALRRKDPWMKQSSSK
jgi:hypothetical protein